MKALMAAMEAFWRGFGMAAYLAGQVPAGAQMPYVTYEVRGGGFGEAMACIGTGWFRGEEANAARAAFLTEVEKRVPECGAVMALEGGVAVVERGSGGFLALVEEEALPRICGGRVMVTVRRYGGGAG